MFTRWYCNVPITSILLITISIALACTSSKVYPSNGLPVLLDGEVFLGRKAEVEMLSEWIENSTVNIISIVGSPGFGKSTLAIHLGHVITENGGVAVLYADLYEVRGITVLKKKLILLVCDEDRLSFDVQHLLIWASKLKVPTVLILDNCDELLHKHKDAFQNLIKNFVRQSQFLKVLLTAKQMTSFLGSFRNLTLTELPTSSAADVLQNLSSTLNRTMALEITGLVGSVPLALQVVGSLLTQVDPSTIANDLRRDPIPALSPELLPSTERVFTSLNISYHYLIPQHQRCRRLLANFPGSFDNSAVQGILEGKLVNDTSECLKALQHKSLLSYNAHTQRYRYHQLIKEFFSFLTSEFTHNKSELLKDKFFYHFEIYYVTLSNNFRAYEASDFYYFLDTERSNIDFLTTYACRTNFTRNLSKNITELMFSVSDTILGVLHTCKSAHSIHSRSPLLGVLLLKALVRDSHIIEKVNHSIQQLQDILQEREHLLHPLALSLKTIYTDMAYLHSCILSGNIHYAVLLGIEIGEQGLIQFDFQFMAVLKHKGLSVSLEMYVNLIVHLSKLEAIVHGQQKAVRVLLLRYERITELFSAYASANDLESRQAYIRYHSALEHNYILLGQFDKFLECEKKILQLKWSLAKCKQVDCTPTHLALAHFGQGNYEESAKHLEALLQSKSLKGSRRVRLFILLYESYRNLGNTERAAHLLTKDHHISRFPSIRNITATDYVNSTNLSILYDRHHGDHFETWLLDKECMMISTKNYRTCLMLAGFYRSLRSEDASKLGNILNHVLGHFIRRRNHWYEMWWYKYDIYSRVSEYNGRNIFDTIMIALALLGIIFVAVLGCIVMLHL